MQELRKDPLGFLRQINEGKEVKIFYHSREFASVKSAQPVPEAQTPKGAEHFLRINQEIGCEVKHKLDPNKSIKQLYAETMDEKYAKKYGLR